MEPEVSYLHDPRGVSEQLDYLFLGVEPDLGHGHRLDPHVLSPAEG